MGNNNFYRGTLTKDDVLANATLLLTLNEYTKVGSITIPADTLIGMGFGDGSAQNDAAGRIYADLKDAVPARVTGNFRIMMMSSNDMPIGLKPVVIDIDTSVLASGSLSARSEQVPFPFNQILLSKDKKFSFFIKNTGTVQTLNKANSTIYIDVTKQLI